MADKTQKTRTQSKAESHGLLSKAYTAAMKAAETMQTTAVDIPLNIIQHMGVPEKKVNVLRGKSRELIRDLYKTIDSAKNSMTGGKAAAEPHKSGARKRGKPKATPR